MADPRGFLKHGREGVEYRPVETRLGDYASVQENRHRFPIHRDEFLLPFNARERSERRAQLKEVLTKVMPHAYSGLLDPANCIEDDFHDFLMADRLLYYVGPLDCPSRSD